MPGPRWTGDARVSEPTLDDDDADERARRIEEQLEPGESRQVTIEADPRLLARFDGSLGAWRIDPGTYRVAADASAAALEVTAEVAMTGRTSGE